MVQEQTPLQQSLNTLADVVREWHKLLEDPYKAPEQKVGLPAEVATAAFNSAVEFAALSRR